MERDHFLVSRADREGCENHSLGFQGSFMEGRMKKSERESRKSRAIEGRKEKYNQ